MSDTEDIVSRQWDCKSSVEDRFWPEESLFLGMQCVMERSQSNSDRLVQVVKHGN